MKKEKKEEKEKELIKIEEKIELDYDCKVSLDAKKIAALEVERIIKEEHIPLDRICGSILVDGKTVSDFFIIEPAKKVTEKTKVKIRPCSDDEWNSYYRDKILKIYNK